MLGVCEVIIVFLQKWHWTSSNHGWFDITGTFSYSREPRENGSDWVPSGFNDFKFYRCHPLLYCLKPGSADGRLLVWLNTLRLISDNPILGWGAGG